VVIARSEIFESLGRFRKGVLQILICLVVLALVIHLFFSRPLMHHLRDSTLQVKDAPLDLVAFGIPESFLAFLKLTLYASLFFSIPLIFYHLWRAFSPLFRKRGLKSSRLVLLTSIALFYLGASFCYFITLPFGVQFLLGYQSANIQPMISVGKYVSFCTFFVFGFGLTFELPLVLALLSYLRLIRASRVDALPEGMQAAVTAHIAGCNSCRRLQADLDSLPPPSEVTRREAQRILSRVRRSARAEGTKTVLPRRALFWRLAFVTACLACAAVITYWQVRRPALAPELPDQAASLNQKAAQAELPGAFWLEKPDVKLTPAVLTWRGRNESGQKFLDDITPALDAYRADRFAEAADSLAALSSRYPDSIEVYFYLGVSRLFLGDYEAAVETLQKAARFADNAFMADVSWYLGLALQRAGRIPDARARFASLCNGKSTYAARACAAVEELNRSVPYR
jgi:Tat protein translocase TatC